MLHDSAELRRFDRSPATALGDAVEEGGAPTPAVALSWQRCARRGVPRALASPLPPTDDDPSLLEAQRYQALARPTMEDVFQFIEGTRCCIAFADADGRLLDMLGERNFVAELTGIGWEIGSCWREECAGTNGLALALLDAFPTQVCGPAHYCDLLRPYCTTAAPVHDSLGGLIGALVVVTPAEQGHPHTLGMVSAAAAALTSELRMNLWLGSANELLFELNAILQTLGEGILLLQPDGVVRQMNARAGRLLGLSPARVAGRRLDDLLAVPSTLEAALRSGRELQDEELTFRVGGRSITCLCTLRAIASLAPLAGPLDGDGASSGARFVVAPPRGALSVAPSGSIGGYVLSLRSIERMQRLAHRMTGAQARMRFRDIVGQSAGMLAAVRLAHIAAEGISTVLLHGETGTGKEVFAQSIHNGSARADGPFVAVNCAAIPRELISSELFGYEGGAFTGADRHGRAGKFELASGGTLFLDEIGDMPRDLQTALLRAIETGSVVRVGGQHVTPVDVRIIAATHKDLAREVELGNFRSDLYFRLNVFPIEVPPLREREGDLPILLRHLLQRLSTRLGRPLGVESEALAALEAYSWPGNVRELENIIERVVYVSQRGIIALDDLPEEIQAAAHLASAHRSSRARSQYGGIGAAPRVREDEIAPGLPGLGALDSGTRLKVEAEGAEAAVIARALRSCGGNVTRAAEQLGISRTTLWRKKRRYHL